MGTTSGEMRLANAQTDAIAAAVSNLLSDATQADAEWIWIEIEKAGGVAMTPQYRLERAEGEQYRLVARSDPGSTNLCAGPTADRAFLVEHAAGRLKEGARAIRSMGSRANGAE